MARKFNINSRTITAPLAAFVMASLLFVYARTSILAAKRNAQKHREADGGQISWRNESLRRHGALEAPAGDGEVVREVLFGSGKKAAASSTAPTATVTASTVEGGKRSALRGIGRTEEEERVREVARESRERGSWGR